MAGFQTENDLPGQYCDSYGAFTVNGKPSLSTTFELRNVPMNFYGSLRAVLKVGGRQFRTEKHVVALGNERQANTQTLPEGGYPKAFNDFPDQLLGEQVLAERYGQAQDILFGKWIVAGSDASSQAVFSIDPDGTKYIRFSADETGESHMFAKSFTPPVSAMVFSAKVRFFEPGSVMTLTSRFPFRNENRLYTNPVTLLFDGRSITLNDSPLTLRGRAGKIKTNRWYTLSLELDKKGEMCQASVANAKGKIVGKSEWVKWKESSNPDFFSIGFTDEASGTIDIAEYEAISPNADAERFETQVEKGNFYRVVVTYQGVLSSGYVNSDLAGYILGSHEAMSTDTLVIACPRDVFDLRIGANAGGEAKIEDVQLFKLPKPARRAKPKVHHIGDSTSASSGSWAWTLERIFGTGFPALAELCDFANQGAGGRNLGTYYQQGKLAEVLLDICPGDIVMLGNNGTNGLNSTFEDDVNYYLDAAEAMGASVILNSYTPHGAVSRHTGGYSPQTHTFDSYRRDTYDVIVRKVAAQRSENDPFYLGFVEIGQNADAIFNAYVTDYRANGYDSAEAAAQAIISCFRDHNHYDKGELACQLMLKGYPACPAPGIVEQLVTLLE
ncbi:MAG: hypothetical protein K5910_00320 [Bacteroidales bacterium]|nr:hypothetical protein [Bacteroidales bacterium]